MAIVTFPAAPTVGDTHNPGNGTVYTYREPGGVGVWVNENTGATLTDNGDGSVTFNSGETGAANVVIDIPGLFVANASGTELDSLLEAMWDQQPNASAAEIAGLSGDETVLVELDGGTLRQLAFDDFPGGGGGLVTPAAADWFFAESKNNGEGGSNSITFPGMPAGQTSGYWEFHCGLQLASEGVALTVSGGGIISTFVDGTNRIGYAPAGATLTSSPGTFLDGYMVRAAWRPV